MKFLELLACSIFTGSPEGFLSLGNPTANWDPHQDICHTWFIVPSLVPPLSLQFQNEKMSLLNVKDM